MPSLALLQWQTDRLPRLRFVAAQCAATAVPQLIDENLRAYVVLLSAHFQGFCRDLHSEASSVLIRRVRPSLRIIFQFLFLERRSLDHKNPTLDAISDDFRRLDLVVRPQLALDPANALRVQHLAAMNQWRNVAAHAGQVPATAGAVDPRGDPGVATLV